MKIPVASRKSSGSEKRGQSSPGSALPVQSIAEKSKGSDDSALSVQSIGEKLKETDGECDCEVLSLV